MSEDVLREFERLLNAQKAGGTGSSIETLLSLMPEESGRLLRRCAIPHEFTPRVLQVLAPGLDETAARARYEEFSQLSSVISVPDGLALHDATRTELFRHWLEPERLPELQDVSKRLVTHYESVMAGTEGRAHEVATHARLFHLLGADLPRGFEEFEAMCRKARHEARWAACGGLIRLVHEYDSVLSSKQASWLAYHEGKLAIDLQQWDQAQSLLAPLLRDHSAPPTLVVRAALRLGYLAVEQGNLDAAARFYELARDITVRHSFTDPPLHCVLRSLGEVYRDRREFDLAEELLNTSLAQAKLAGDLASTADTYNSLGTLCVRRRDFTEGASAYRASLEVLERLGRTVQCAQVHNNLGMVYAEQREWVKAFESYEKSLEIKRQVGDSLGQAKTLVNLVQLNRGRGQIESAMESCERAMGLFEAVRHPLGLAQAGRTLGRLHSERGDVQRAVAAFEEAAGLFRRLGKENEAREISAEASAVGRRVRIPWWAWLMVGFWGLLFILILLVLAFV